MFPKLAWMNFVPMIVRELPQPQVPVAVSPDGAAAARPCCSNSESWHSSHCKSLRQWWVPTAAQLQFAQDNSGRRLSKIIKWLKQAGEGARRGFKDGAWACWLKVQKQMVLSYRSGQISTQEPENARRRLWKTIGLLKPTGEGTWLQFPGWIIRLVQQRFENKLYEMIGVANSAHRKMRWKSQKIMIIVWLKSAREGTLA